MPTPGRTVIQRANKFTNYAGTFLYVEAHNKDIVRTAPGPQRLHAARRWRCRSRARPATTARRPRCRASSTPIPTPDEYLYNKVLVRLTAEQAAIPASQLTVRVAASNGTDDTYKVTEWLGTALPPHVAGYQQGFFSRYQDPTENRAAARQAGHRVPEPGDPGQPAEPHERLPAQVVRRSCTARPPSASAPPVTLGALLILHRRARSRPRSRSPRIPFTGRRGPEHPRDRQRRSRPVDRLHPGHQDPPAPSCRRSTRAPARRP